MSLPNPPKTVGGWVMFGSLILALGTSMIGIAFWLGQLSTSHDDTRMLAQENAKAIQRLVILTERHEAAIKFMERRLEWRHPEEP